MKEDIKTTAAQTVKESKTAEDTLLNEVLKAKAALAVAQHEVAQTAKQNRKTRDMLYWCGFGLCIGGYVLTLIMGDD